MNLFAWIAPWLWWSLLAVGFTASLAGLLAWYVREVTERRLPAPRFFLIALAFHVLLATGSFFVYLDNGAGAQIRHRLHEFVVASGAPLKILRESLRAADDGFGTVADLESVTTESPAAGPSVTATPPLLSTRNLTAPLEPLGPMLPPAQFAAPPGEAMASLDLGNLPRRRTAVAAGIEPIEIEALHGVEQPSTPRIEGIAVEKDRTAVSGAPPTATVAMLAGPISEPFRTTTGASGTGAPASLALDNFAPLTVTEVPRLNRAVRPVASLLPEIRAEMEALSAPAGGTGDGTGGGPGQLAAATLGSVEIARPGLAAAPAPRSLPSELASSGDATGLADVARRVGQASVSGGLRGGDGPEGATAPFGTAPGGPSGERLARRNPRSPTLMYAEDNIGLQAMFRMRQSEDKQDQATAVGGTSESLAAVHRGLKWFVEHQHPNGYWSLHRFYPKTPGQNYGGAAGFECDVAATGLALLPLLGDGHTHMSGEYQSAVSRGLTWMLTQQKGDGELTGKIGREGRMYAHAIAAIVLCEAYGMTKDPKLRDPAQRAIDFIVAAQHKPSGGWRYNPQQASDTSVVGWQVMAMKSGQMAALKVPQESLDLVHKWLRSVEGKDAGIGTFKYQEYSAITPAMTAEGLLCLEYLGAQPNDPRLQSGVKYLLNHLPRKGQESSYYWYYGTQALYHVQGDAWRQWNLALRDMLVETQVKTGHLAGTWDPGDQWEHQAGRLYASSLRLLVLEVYFRHLPLYRLSER